MAVVWHFAELNSVTERCLNKIQGGYHLLQVWRWEPCARHGPWLVEKTERHYCKETRLKRYCKNIDITDRNFIEKAVFKCLDTRMDRRDTMKLLSEYINIPYPDIKRIAEKTYYQKYLNGAIQTLIDGIRQEILDRKYKVKPIFYRNKIDGNSGKLRRIGIQDVKQQIYDYIACETLWEMFEAKIGYYQTEALNGKGQLTALKAIRKWLSDPDMRYAIQSDIRQFYTSIDKEVLKTMLSRDVNDEPLLHLTFFLIDMSEQGLVIGSYLNKNLASYYLSVAYHYVTEQCYKERRGKRKRLLSHALWYADDCILIGKDLRDLKMCQRKYEKFLKEKLHVEVKPNTKVIDLKTGYIDIVGFKISRKNATMRASNFRRMRKNLKRINRYTADNIPLHEARAFNSRSGSFKHLDMLQYIKDNNITELLDSCNNTIRAKTERRTICEKWYSIQNRTALK